MTTQTAGLAVPRARRFSDRQFRRWQEVSLGYVLLAPALIILVVFEFFPIFYGLYISTCDWRLDCTKFIGIDNYTRAFTDPAMWHSLLITATYAVVAMPLQLDLLLAYWLFQNGRARTKADVIDALKKDKCVTEQIPTSRSLIGLSTRWSNRQSLAIIPSARILLSLRWKSDGWLNGGGQETVGSHVAAIRTRLVK
jgi:hypothetical protein